MNTFLLVCIVISASFPAFSQAITSNVYAYNQSPIIKHTGYDERTLLEGTTRDFSHLIVQDITLKANQPNQPTQQLDEEAVLIIKTGELTLTLGGKRKILGPGCVAVIMPGDDYRVENKASQSLTYYLMRYTSNEMPDLDLYRLVGDSFWIDWQEMSAKAEGENRQTKAYSTIMSNRMVAQIVKLGAGLGKQPAHSHRAAEILVILDHPVQVQLNGELKGAQTGDFIFVESETAHSIYTIKSEDCTYLSLQF
ncbi:cupin [Spirosoma aureum]|uniref:Cupin n=1 Tax=Spirosoma aureum TaxID=2692134 RepID=A0A6G9AR04_9BACT|nr:cupin [Spirosoma aureum]QIP14922.1 cupin [Spirosoma aureum]